MSLAERLADDMKAALKARDGVRLETIRAIRGAVRNKEIEVGATLDDEGIVRVIRALARQRADSIEQYAAAGRQDLVAKETAEKGILEGYLPAAPGEDEIERVVRQVIAETGAQGPKDMGRVMKPALERLGPAADGKLVSQSVRRLLSGG